MDDGAATLADSVEMARSMRADGVEAVAATPHVRADYPTAPETMERLVAELRHALEEHGVALEILPGGELELERLGALGTDALRRFGLGGSDRYLLVEFPYYGWPLELGLHVFHLRAGRITPVLAHPERNAEVQEEPERLRPIVEQGAVVQITAASVDGRLGGRAQRTAFELLERELAHVLASDAHGPAVRESGLSAAVAAVGDEALGSWLAREVPAAIVRGGPLPARPARRRARRRWLRGR